MCDYLHRRYFFLHKSCSHRTEDISFRTEDTSSVGALVAQWLALLTSVLEGPGSNPG
jgi:hypothetical protein